jgi:two-component system NtrC family sensor kinase
MSSLGKLSASIAHEINNPLMGILTVSKLVLRQMEGGQFDDGGRAQATKNLKMVQRETERCSAIVRNLLDFARQRPLTLKLIDVNLALEESLSVAANQMSIQQVKLEKQFSQGAVVQADLGQLRQAFLNVVMNAIEAMPKGGALKIYSRVLEDHTVQVEVADSGGGIPQEILGKIFDPFFTTKEKGTGLGLSVTYGIIQRHGGKLEVKSEVGVGTRVVISLPQALGEQVAA